MRKLIQLTEEALDEKIDKLAGTYLGEDDYDILITEDCEVRKPNGDLLLIFRKGVLPSSYCKRAYPALRKAATISYNRGLAAGDAKDANIGPKGDVSVYKTRVKPIKSDGTVSNTQFAKAVESGVIGFYDRYPRIPYCRLTAFSLDHPEKFREALPLIRSIDQVFKEEVPDRYNAQLEMVKKTSKDFYIHGTSFTTITINRNFRTALHKDKGDLKQGFGVSRPR